MVNLYKARFETPKECLDLYIQQHPERKGSKATYAGRLDPLAEGVLPVLFGDAVHHKESVTALKKEYLVKILFGFATDSGDVLGKLTNTDTTAQVTLGKLLPAIESLVGIREQTYPLYSSKTVGGKALHEYGRAMEEVERPTHQITIETITLSALTMIETKDIESLVHEACTKVQGDFRQKEILSTWEESLRHFYNKQFPLAEIRVVCGGGTYMRVLAEELGEMLGLPALAFHIIRTRVGDLTIADTINPHRD